MAMAIVKVRAQTTMVSFASCTLYTSIFSVMIDHTLPSPTTCGEESLDEEGSSDHDNRARGCGGDGYAQVSSQPLAAVKGDWHAVEASPLPVPTPHIDETM